MPTEVTTRKGASAPTTRIVKESAKSVADEVNTAIAGKLKFVVLTDNETGDEFSVVAAEVRDIKAVS